MKKSIIISFTFFVILYIRTVELCTADQFQCSDGECIPSVKRCDEDFHCRDYSDEVNCTGPNQQCPESLQRCYNGQCVTDLNQCPTPTFNYTATKVSSISISQLQKSSSGVVGKSSLDITKIAVKETATTLVGSVTRTTEDHIPATDNSNLLYLLFLLLLIPIGLAACIVCNRSDKQRF